MKKVYLTFDMDWASDDVMKYFYEKICNLNICGTLNVTNDTPILDEIRKGGRLELGIHPNFNQLLCNDKKETRSAETIIKNLKDIVPDAVSARSHSLLTSSYINQILYENGIRYESNYFYHPDRKMKVRCFKDYMGLMHIPFFYEDDIYLMSTERNTIMQYLDDYDAPLVFNFHPIHIFLNTENMSRYLSAKKYYHTYNQLKTYRNMNKYGGGACDMLEMLVANIHERGYQFRMIKEIAQEEL